MSELAVDKIKQPVTLNLADGSQIAGHVFLSPYSELGVGRQTLHEVMTNQNRFIPFETAAGEFWFLNKTQVVRVAVKLGREGRRELAGVTRHNASIQMLDGKIIKGQVVMDAPEEKSRLSDCLNQAESFIVLEETERAYLINVRYVLRVFEV